LSALLLFSLRKFYSLITLFWHNFVKVEMALLFFKLYMFQIAILPRHCLAYKKCYQAVKLSEAEW
jgi:hypothetical protein